MLTRLDNQRCRRRITRWLCAPLAAIALAASTFAQLNRDETPPELEGVGVVERLDAQLPLDLPFVDDVGKPVRLGDYFTPGRPVILTLNYYRCPMLCDEQLKGLVAGLREMSETPSRDFQIVTVSFEPLETWELAKLKKRAYVNALERPEAARGWCFLTGKKPSIEALTSAVGFTYKWNSERQEWAHPPVLILCTPDGRISRYLGDMYPEPRTLRMSLVEASSGNIGTLWDQVFLTCFQWESRHGRYSFYATNLVRFTGAATIVALGATIAVLWRREVRRRRAAMAACGGRPGAL